MRTHFVATIAVAALALPALAADLPKPSGETIVSPDAKLQKLYTRSANINGGLTEGPAVAPDGDIYFSDIPLGQDHGLILRYDPRMNKTTVFAENSHKSNGLIFDSQGRLIACEGANYGGRGIARWDTKTGKRTVLVNKFHGKRFNSPNDLCVDSHDRVYFTDPRYLGEEPRELEHRAVYRVDPDGKVAEVTHDLSKPNGIALSPDGKTLYVANHDNGTDNIPADPDAKPGVMCIYAFPLGADGLVHGKRRTLIDFGDEKGCDGMTVDSRGNLYLTVRSKTNPSVRVYNPHGQEIARIPTGPQNQSTEAETVGLPSNVEFGLGCGRHTLYITIDKSLYRITLKSEGYHRQYKK